MIDRLRQWMGRTLDWCMKRPGWQLIVIIPVLLFLLILSKLIGKVKNEKYIQSD